jgi:hypothetical protein
MALDQAHKGYEYQDLVTAYFILREVLNGNSTKFTIDQKQFKGDRFDDLTISSDAGVTKKQFKYSDFKELEKTHLASESYDLSLDGLFKSWKNDKSTNLTELRVCLAWNEPLVDDIKQVLNEEKSSGQSFDQHTTKLFRVDVEKLWPQSEGVLKNWRRLRKESKSIDRNEFIAFCDCLIIEVDFPKFSLDLQNPGPLEVMVLDQLKGLGVGEYPNQELTLEGTALNLTHLIKRYRAQGQGEVEIDEILRYLRIVTDYGAIPQEFPVDDKLNVVTQARTEQFIRSALSSKKVLLTAEPGAGKSWFVNNLETIASEQGIEVIKHYCFTDLEDALQEQRITTNAFYGNLIADILKRFPDLKDAKTQLFASNLSELNLLLQRIPDQTILVIDGLDHIERVYETHNTGMGRTAIDIISRIAELSFGDNVSCIVSSQPIKELEEFDEFSATALPTWTEDEVKALLDKYALIDSELEEGQFLSDYLLHKSDGNLLYLTYLIKEVKRLSYVTLEAMDELPAYSYNLEPYYNFLLTKMDGSQDVPRILSGASFRLQAQELKDITHLGAFVEKQLTALSPILRSHQAVGGHILYHESFRRFIIEKLREEEVEIQTAIYQPIIRWMASNDFFAHTKTYRFYLALLFECEEYHQILEFLTPDFARRSLFHGHSPDAMKQNYGLFLKAVCRKKDPVKLVVLIELSRTIGSTEDEYYEAFPFYFQALGSLRGFEKAAEYLSFDARPTLSGLLGIRACYVCERNGVKAPWFLYDDAFGKGQKIELENFRYYLKMNLVNENWEGLTDIAKQLKSKKHREYIAIYLEELDHIDDKTLRKKLALTQLANILDTRINGDIVQLASRLHQEEHITEQHPDLFNQFFKLTRQAYLAKEFAIIDQVKLLFHGNFWYHNWILYGISLQELLCQRQPQDHDVKSCFSLLIQNTKPFEGQPRACDLYYLHPTIQASIEDGLKLVNGTSLFQEIIDLLIQLSKEVSTSFRKSIAGPFSSQDLFRLFIDYADDESRDYVIEKLTLLLSELEQYQLHAYVAEYYFHLSRLNAEAGNETTSENQLKKGIQYLVAYTHRKDTTFLELTDSIESLAKVDLSLAREEVRDLKQLADSVVDHTDGKSTSHFPVTWYEKYLTISPNEAQVYLLNKLKKVEYNWWYEDDLQTLLSELDGRKYPVVELLLTRTYPNDPNEEFQSLKLNRIENAEEVEKEIAKIELAQVNTIVSSTRDPSYSEDFLDRLEKVNTAMGLSVQVRRSSPDKGRSRYIQDINFSKRFDHVRERKSFSEMSQAEVGAYLKDFEPLDSELVSLYYYFSLQTELSEDLKSLIWGMTQREKYLEHKKHTREHRCFETGTLAYTYYWMSRFVHDRGGWGEGFVNIEAFEKAYHSDPNFSLEILFELVYPLFTEVYWSHGYGSNLINSFVKVGITDSETKQMWFDLKESISSRLPSQDVPDWDSLLENELALNEEERLLCMLLCRFKNGTVDRYERNLSSLHHLLVRYPDKMVKPLKWYFKNEKHFLRLTTSELLELLYAYNRMNSTFLPLIKDDIKRIYPTRFFLIDYVIEQLFPEIGYEKLTYPGSWFIPAGDEDVAGLLRMNRKYGILDRMGFDMPLVFGRYQDLLRSKRADDLDLYWNNAFNTMATNVYHTVYLNDAINELLYSDFFHSEVPSGAEIHFYLRLDIEFQVSYANSLGLRPNVLRPLARKTRFTSTDQIPIDDGWVRLGYFEEEIETEMTRGKKIARCYSAVSFAELNDEVPYGKYVLNTLFLWGGNAPSDEVDPNVVSSFIQQPESLEEYYLLWLNPEIMQALELISPKRFEPLRAYNAKGEEVLKFSRWRHRYIWNEKSLDSEIPAFKGSELLIREDCYDALCGLFEESPKYYEYRQEEQFKPS